MLRIRQGADGSVWIPRKNKETEAYLDKKYARLPNELRWVPKPERYLNVVDLKAFFKNHLCYIVGKGESLDMLTADCFPNKQAPIIALNESIHKVEELDLVNPTMCLQQDSKLRATCRPIRSVMIGSVDAMEFYQDVDFPYAYMPGDFGIYKATLSAVAAVNIAAELGATAFELWCFDGCMEGSLEYAECIGYDSGRDGAKERFKTHRKKIEMAASPRKVTFVMPPLLIDEPEPTETEDLVDTDVCTPEPQADSQPEHHAPLHEESPSETKCSSEIVSEIE